MPADNSLLDANLDDHIAATRHYFTGAPDSPEPPYVPSYYPPTGYWTSAEKALFFHALSTHSRFRPDLIASSIGTKSLLDVMVYLSLLQDGAQGLTAVRGAIARDQLPAAHEVSAELIALEDAHATRPGQTEEACAVVAAARKEAERAMRNSMRARKGEGSKGAARDRAGQQERREAFGRWRAEQERAWAREDSLAQLDGVALQAMDRMLRADGDAGPSSAVIPADDSEDVLANLSPASRRRTYKRLYMRRKRAEARGDVAQLDPVRLKPGRKSSKHKQRLPSADDSTDEDGDRSDDDAEQKRRLHGPTRPYKVQRRLEGLGIGAEYMRENGLGLFRLGALWRLMRLYPRLDPSQPQGVTESISAGTIQALHTLVVHFTRDVVRRALTLRELEFARRGHLKMWRLGKRLVRPPHVRRALQTRGACTDKYVYFDGLLARFSEAEEESSEEEIPLALLMRRRAAEASESEEDIPMPSSDEEEEEDGVWTDEEDALPMHSQSRHREPYVPLVYAPDLIASAHPFGVYAPGTIPEPLGAISKGVPHDDDLMSDETDDEALEVELAGEALLDAVDARAAAAYEARVWRDLRAAPRIRKRARKRVAPVEEHGHSMPLRKRRKTVRGASVDALKSPDGINVKSAAMIEDSDSDSEYME